MNFAYERYEVHLLSASVPKCVYNEVPKVPFDFKHANFSGADSVLVR